MTDTQWLLDLVEEATPGPWKLEHSWDDYGGPEPGDPGGDWVSPHGAYSTNPKDNALIALAPDLARLVVEQHEALASIVNGEEFDVDLESARAALARFAELNP